MSLPVKVLVKRLPHAAHLPLPRQMTAGSAGMDLCAALDGEITLPVGAYKLIPSGIALAIPPGYEGQVRPRSGLAAGHGLTILNSQGTVDSDYRGEIKILLLNLGPEPYLLQPGERIAQLVISPLPRITLHEVETLPESARGQEGFGHTGRFEP